MLKVFRDIVVDGRGTPPINPTDILESWSKDSFSAEDIGYLTKSVKIEEWLRTVRVRFAFLAEMTAEELRWCDANARYRNEVEAALLPQ